MISRLFLAFLLSYITPMGAIHAALLFEESFDYPGSVFLNGRQNSDTGTQWSFAAGNRDAFIANSFDGSALSGLAVEGVAVSQFSQNRITLDLSTLAQIVNPTPGTSLYISFAQFFNDLNLDQSRTIEFRRGNGITDVNTVFTYGTDTFGGGAGYGLLVEKGDPGAVRVPAGPISVGAQLIVLRIDYGLAGTPDSIKVYRNPINGTTEPEQPTVVYENSAGFDLSFDRIGLAVFQGGRQEVDEIRIATTFAEAVPGLSQRLVPGEPLMEESFAYPSGSLIGNTNADSQSAWMNVVGGGNTSVAGDQSLVPVDFAGLRTSGGTVTQEASARASLNLNSISEIDDPENSSTLYISFIQKFGDSSPGNTKIVEFWEGLPGDGNVVFSFGKDTNPIAPDYGLLIGKGQSNAMAISAGAPNTASNLVVLRIDYGNFNRSDAMRVYMNPGSVEPSIPDAFALNEEDFSLEFDHIGYGAFQGGMQFIDELRIGQTYSSVVPARPTLLVDGVISGVDSAAVASVSAAEVSGAKVADFLLLNGSGEEVLNSMFSLVEGMGDDENSLFEVVGSELFVANDLSSRVGETVSVRFRGEDEDGSFAEQTFLIQVLSPADLPASIDPASVGKFLDGFLPQVMPAPGNGAFLTVDAFPSLDFGELIGLTVEPRSDHLFILERDGEIYRVANDSTTTEATRVFNTSVSQRSNGGMRSMICHPEFNDPNSPHQNDAFIFYSTSSSGQFVYRLSRITRGSDGQFGNEQVMIQQRAVTAGEHFGGSLAFDENGFLIVGIGDLEITLSRNGGVPLYQDAQRIDRIFQSAILRLDVDMQGGSISAPAPRTLQGGMVNGISTSQSCLPGHPYFSNQNFSGIGYFIPADNYFVLNPPSSGVGGTNPDYPPHGDALQEYQALGVRNPWRIAVDPVDHDLVWFSVGSNGSERYEEIDLLRAGGNYGWPFAEAIFSDSAETERFTPPSVYAPIYLGESENTSPRQIDPLYFYQSINTGDRAIAGGVFYRGTQFPDLVGKLIYGDAASGRIWALDYKDKAPADISNELIVDSSVLVRQMMAGPQGEKIYLVDGNGVYLLSQNVDGNPEPPALLSQTGAFTDLASLTPHAGLIPYTPGSPLWSDRAVKRRWVALPNDQGIPGEFDLDEEKMVFSADGNWTFPIGTVFVKHFELPTDERDPENNLIRLETRFLVLGEDDVYFAFTYRWRPDGSDADLLSDGESGTFEVINTVGQVTQQTWDYPSRQNCMECHQPDVRPVLGFRTSQLNNTITYPGAGSANQLVTLQALNAFIEPSIEVSAISSFRKSVDILDVASTLDHRVRSYLDVNCAMCHQPGAEAGRAEFDARLQIPLNLTGMIDGIAQSGDLGIAGARVIVPGDPDRSVLYVRDRILGNNQMPPIARNVVHGVYVEELRAWIQQLALDEYQQYASDGGLLGRWDEDEDGDGQVNLMEFVVGTDATARESHFQPSVTSDFFYRFPVSGAARTDGVRIRLEDSPDLQQWYGAGELNSRTTIQGDSSSPGTDGMIELLFDLNEPQRYIRAQVSPR